MSLREIVVEMVDELLENYAPPAMTDEEKKETVNIIVDSLCEKLNDERDDLEEYLDKKFERKEDVL